MIDLLPTSMQSKHSQSNLVHVAKNQNILSIHLEKCQVLFEKKPLRNGVKKQWKKLTARGGKTHRKPIQVDPSGAVVNAKSQTKKKKCVRFSKAPCKVRTFSPNHGTFFRDGDDGDILVKKAHLWWTPEDTHRRRSVEHLLQDADDRALQFLTKARELEEQAEEWIEDAEYSCVLTTEDMTAEETEELEPNKVVSFDVDEAFVNHVLRWRLCDYRGLESYDEYHAMERRRFVGDILIEQELLMDLVHPTERAERLRWASEQGSLKWRIVARQWGHIDSLESKQHEGN